MKGVVEEGGPHPSILKDVATQPKLKQPTQ